MWHKKECEFASLAGSVLLSLKGLEKDSTEVVLTTNNGVFKLEHYQDCCEYVRLVDFESDLLETDFPVNIISAEEVTNTDDRLDVARDDSARDDSFTWTFYKIETDKGGIWMRWLGESNGCYSEEVCLYKIDGEE